MPLTFPALARSERQFRRCLMWALFVLSGFALSLVSLNQAVEAQQTSPPTGRVLTIDGAIGRPPWII